MAKKGNEDKTTDVAQNQRKWGRKTWSAGWTGIPSALIEYQDELGLSSLDVCILMNLAMHWWDSTRPPFPSKETIARRIGVTPRTVQRRIAELEIAGFVRREERREFGRGAKGSRTNLYHLDGLKKALEPFAEKIHREKQVKMEASLARKQQRKKVFRVISGGE